MLTWRLLCLMGDCKTINLAALLIYLAITVAGDVGIFFMIACAIRGWPNP